MDIVGKESVGVCHGSVPHLSPTYAMTCMVLNSIPITSGFGTMISACAGDKFNPVTLLFGLCQFFLVLVVVGYLWSIWH